MRRGTMPYQPEEILDGSGPYAMDPSGPGLQGVVIDSGAMAHLPQHERRQEVVAARGDADVGQSGAEAQWQAAVEAQDAMLAAGMGQDMAAALEALGVGARQAGVGDVQGVD